MVDNHGWRPQEVVQVQSRHSSMCVTPLLCACRTWWPYVSVCVSLCEGNTRCTGLCMGVNHDMTETDRVNEQ